MRKVQPLFTMPVKLQHSNKLKIPLLTTNAKRFPTHNFNITTHVCIMIIFQIMIFKLPDDLIITFTAITTGTYKNFSTLITTLFTLTIFHWAISSASRQIVAVFHSFHCSFCSYSGLNIVNIKSCKTVIVLLIYVTYSAGW